MIRPFFRSRTSHFWTRTIFGVRPFLDPDLFFIFGTNSETRPFLGTVPVLDMDFFFFSGPSFPIAGPLFDQISPFISSRSFFGSRLMFRIWTFFGSGPFFGSKTFSESDLFFNFEPFFGSRTIYVRTFFLIRTYFSVPDLCFGLGPNSA